MDTSPIDPTAEVERLPRVACAAPAGMADGHVIGAVTARCDSFDLGMRTESLVIATPHAMATGDQIRMLGWRDDERGFAARVIDMARRMAGEGG